MVRRGLFFLAAMAVIFGVGYVLYVRLGYKDNRRLVIFKKPCLMANRSYQPGSYLTIQLREGCATCSCVSGPAFSCVKTEKCPE